MTYPRSLLVNSPCSLTLCEWVSVAGTWALWDEQSPQLYKPWLDSMNISQIVWTECSFSIGETELPPPDVPPIVLCFRKLNELKPRADWFHQKTGRTSLSFYPAPSLKRQGWWEADCTLRRERPAGGRQAREGRKRACFVLFALESTCSLIKGKTALRLVKTPPRKLK